MKPTERLRALLDDYYAGCSSPAQIAEITSLLNSISPLPDDLKIEKAIFDSVGKTAEASIPEPDRLKAIFENTTTQKTPHRHILYIWRAIAAAAIIAIIVTIGVSIFRSIPAKDMSGPLTAQNKTIVKPEISQTPTKQPEFTSLDSDQNKQNNIDRMPKATDSDNTPDRSVRPPKRQLNRQSQSETNLIIVTDPDDAKRYTAIVDNIVTSAMMKTGEANRQAADAFEKANAGLDRILNKTLQQKI